MQEMQEMWVRSLGQEDPLLPRANTRDPTHDKAIREKT